VFVIPAKAGIHYFRYLQVPGFPLSREWQLLRSHHLLYLYDTNPVLLCKL